DGVDRYRINWTRRNAPLLVPRSQLFITGGVHDSTKPNQSVGCRTHRAVLPGSVDDGAAALLLGEVFCRPTGNLKLRVSRVIPARDPISISEEYFALGTHQYRTKRFIAVVQSLFGQFYALLQVVAILLCQFEKILHVSMETRIRANGNAPGMDSLSCSTLDVPV